MTPRELSVARLAATPTLLHEMTRDLTGELGSTPPKPGEWSIVEVVRHLVEGDRGTFLPRLRRMLTESRPAFDKTLRPPRDTAVRPVSETTGTPIHRASQVVVPPVNGNGSRPMSISW